MKCMTKYVGLDVHQATTVASVRAEGGRVLARVIVPTEEPAIVEFFRGMRGAIHVAFEEGTQAQWLHDLLAPLVDRVVVCDRRGEPRQGNKGDQVDADGLSELLRRGGLRAVYHASSHRATLKELTRTYQNLVEDSTRVMLRLKALFRARGLNSNYQRALKDVFKGAATAATALSGPLQDIYHRMVACGVREELARLTLARKLAAITLRLWKRGESYDPTKLTRQAF